LYSHIRPIATELLQDPYPDFIEAAEALPGNICHPNIIPAPAESRKTLLIRISHYPQRSWRGFASLSGNQNVSIVPEFVANLVGHFANNQLRLSLWRLPAESQAYKLSCAEQELTIAFARQ